MTPANVAQFMACFLVANPSEETKILDAGAGDGALSCAVLDVWRPNDPSLISLTAFEVDDVVLPHLRRNLSARYQDNFQIIKRDYIEHSVVHEARGQYTHAILNPPYRKISSKSQHRHLLRQAGIETGNLYSAFVALALRDMKAGGQLVAIIPRSFCNGPYFKPFRQYILSRAALTHVHLFGSRKDAFKEDGVLQENIIIRLVKGQKQGEVEVSVSEDASFMDLQSTSYPFESVVKPEDEDQFIHIPSNDIQTKTGDTRVTLSEIGLSVSTGPVVGFRLKSHLREVLNLGDAPLLYPVHFRNGRVRWPLEIGGKPNAIEINEDTKKWLYPNGHYCVVRRFSSKEERHRIVASVVEPNDIKEADFIGLDNKLNFFHENKNTLPQELAHGLAAYLNTNLVDEEFRLFSGHTQVNATDLRKMTYPDRASLEQIGRQVIAGEAINEADIYSYFLEANQPS